jgi:hypothetical protein
MRRLELYKNSGSRAALNWQAYRLVSYVYLYGNQSQGKLVAESGPNRQVLRVSRSAWGDWHAGYIVCT